MSTVGFPDSTVRESRDRGRAAIRTRAWSSQHRQPGADLQKLRIRLARSWGERKLFMSKRLKGEKKS